MSEKLTKDLITEKLRTIKYPGFSRDIVSFGLVKEILIDGSRVGVGIVVTTNDVEVPKKIYEEATALIKAIDGVTDVDVKVDALAAPKVDGTSAQTLPQESIPGIRHIIAVASGKGGVGKSTLATNLAAAFKKQGLQVGLCDCDLYGPSVGLMFGEENAPESTPEGLIIPMEKHGIKLMSMGFFVDDRSPVVLRGPMVTRYTQQFLRQVMWGGLDVLILDLPPGTGDIQLTISQTVSVSGALVVSTPQEVALIDARKAVSMFQKVNIPILGLVENMSYFLCPSDQKRYDIFGSGGCEIEAKKLEIPLLAQIPIEIPLREAGDTGTPLTLSDPDCASSKIFLSLAKKLLKQLSSS